MKSKTVIQAPDPGPAKRRDPGYNWDGHMREMQPDSPENLECGKTMSRGINTEFEQREGDRVRPKQTSQDHDALGGLYGHQI
jgi:hypothetical protein